MSCGCVEGNLPDGRYVAAGEVATSGSDGRVCAVLVIEGEDVLLVREEARDSGEHRITELRGTVTDEGGCSLSIECYRTKVAGDLQDKECVEPQLPVACAFSGDGSISIEYGVLALVAFEEDAACSDAFRIDEVY